MLCIHLVGLLIYFKPERFLLEGWYLSPLSKNMSSTPNCVDHRLACFVIVDHPHKYWLTSWRAGFVIGIHTNIFVDQLLTCFVIMCMDICLEETIDEGASERLANNWTDTRLSLKPLINKTIKSFFSKKKQKTSKHCTD